MHCLLNGFDKDRQHKEVGALFVKIPACCFVGALRSSKFLVPVRSFCGFIPVSRFQGSSDGRPVLLLVPSAAASTGRVPS